MDWEAWAVLLVLATALTAFYFEAGPPDQVMLGGLVLLWHLGVVTTAEAFKGFSNSSVITIGALFVVARAVDRSKVVDRATRGLLGRRTSERGARLRLCVAGMSLSGFMNNTPLVALLMPIVRDWARSRGFSASKFLIPLSYSTIMGGLLTIIGSSTNLVVNGLLIENGFEPFSFFDPAFVGLPVGLVALAYLLLVAPSLLPDNRGGLFRALREGKEDLVTELKLTSRCPFLGSSIFEALDEFGIHEEALIKIFRQIPLGELSASNSDSVKDESRGGAHSNRARSRHALRTGLTKPLVDSDPRVQQWGQQPVRSVTGVACAPIFPVPSHEVACEGDVLVLSLPQELLTHLVSARPQGLQIQCLHPLDIAGDDSEFVEVVLAPESPLVGCHLSNAAHIFRSKYHAALVAVRNRNSAAPVAKIAGQSPASDGAATRSAEGSPWPPQSTRSLFSTRDVSVQSQSDLGAGHRGSEGALAVGDVALLLVSSEVDLPHADFLTTTRVAGLPPPTTFRDLLPLFAFAIGLLGTMFAGVSMQRVAVTLSVVIVLGGWVKPREVREVVDWSLLILIGSALGMAAAVQRSGLSASAAALVKAAGLPPAGALSLLFLATMAVTELVTNNAAAALGLSLAVDLAKELGLKSPRPFAMAVMLAASTSYACPIGYATNLMVLGPGDYKFGDFLRVGIWMDIIYWVGCSLLLPQMWPFE